MSNLCHLFYQLTVTSDDDQSSKRFTFNNFKDWTRRKANSTFTKKLLYKRLPILRWLPQYNGDDAVGDLVAGITVGLTVIPQALAYAGIAGVPVAVSFRNTLCILQNRISFFVLSVWIVQFLYRLFHLYYSG